MRTLAALAVTLTLTACASAAWNAMSASDKDVWVRCLNSVQNANCPGGVANQDTTTKVLCMKPLMDEYAAAADHQRWLIQHGCPRDMVE